MTLTSHGRSMATEIPLQKYATSPACQLDVLLRQLTASGVIYLMGRLELFSQAVQKSISSQHPPCKLDDASAVYRIADIGLRPVPAEKCGAIIAELQNRIFRNASASQRNARLTCSFRISVANKILENRLMLPAFPTFLDAAGLRCIPCCTIDGFLPRIKQRKSSL